VSTTDGGGPPLLLIIGDDVGDRVRSPIAAVDQTLGDCSVRLPPSSHRVPRDEAHSVPVIQRHQLICVGKAAPR
jgi:hypothetical protein